MNYYTERCIKCRKQHFSQDYEGAPLSCMNCGLVGYTEQIPENELELLSQQLLNTSFNEPEDMIRPEYLEMLKEVLEEEKRKKRKMSLEDQMEQLKVRPLKKPSSKKRSN